MPTTDSVICPECRFFVKTAEHSEWCLCCQRAPTEPYRYMLCRRYKKLDLSNVIEDILSDDEAEHR